MELNYIIRAFYSAYNTQTTQQERGKLIWKRFMEQEPTGKQYSEEKDTRKSKQY